MSGRPRRRRRRSGTRDGGLYPDSSFHGATGSGRSEREGDESWLATACVSVGQAEESLRNRELLPIGRGFSRSNEPSYAKKSAKSRGWRNWVTLSEVDGHPRGKEGDFTWSADFSLSFSRTARVSPSHFLVSADPASQSVNAPLLAGRGQIPGFAKTCSFLPESSCRAFGAW
jgi:hypothetical protein